MASATPSSAAAMASATPVLVIVPPGYGAFLPPGSTPPQPGDTGMTPVAPPPLLSEAQLAEDRGRDVYWSVAMMIVICTLFFGLRVYARFKTRLFMQVSDWVLAAGILCAYGFGAVYIWSVREGAGRHFEFLVKQNPERTLLGLPYEAMFIASNIYFASIALVKLSILALYYEIFRSSIRFRWAVYTLSFLVIAWWFGFTIFNFKICDPISNLWDLSPNNKHNCIIGPHYLINGVSNILTDFFILLLPTRVVWSLKLPTRARIGLIIIFLLGSIVCIASSFRLAYTFFVRDFDPSWHLVPLEMWSAIEVTVAVVAACSLTLRPLLKSLMPGFATRALSRWTSGSGSGGRSNSGKHRPRHKHRRSGHVSLGDDLTAVGTVSDAPGKNGTVVGKDAIAMDDLWQAGRPGHVTPGGHHHHGTAVSTRISARPIDAERTGTEASSETVGDDVEKGLGSAGGSGPHGQIRVMREGPFFSVESRRGSRPGEGSITDGEPARGDASSDNNISTKELCPK